MKPWYTSKLVWVGLIQTLIAVLLLVQEWWTRGDFSVPAFLALAVGILVIVLRVWFTDAPIDTGGSGMS